MTTVTAPLLIVRDIAFCEAEDVGGKVLPSSSALSAKHYWSSGEVIGRGYLPSTPCVTNLGRMVRKTDAEGRQTTPVWLYSLRKEIE